jgi:glutathione S-transferase
VHKEIFAPGLAKYFPLYEKLLKESGSGFLVKGGLTWIDFVVSEFFNTIVYMDPVSWKKYPTLEEYRERVQSLPQIKKYVESRKYSVV